MKNPKLYKFSNNFIKFLVLYFLFKERNENFMKIFNYVLYPSVPQLWYFTYSTYFARILLVYTLMFYIVVLLWVTLLAAINFTNHSHTEWNFCIAS